MRGEGVAQHMRAHPFRRDTRSSSQFLHHLVKPDAAQMTFAGGESHADSAATWTDHWAMAARARTDIGARRSLPPFPRKIRKGRSVAMALRGNETSSLARRPDP